MKKIILFTLISTAYLFPVSSAIAQVPLGAIRGRVVDAVLDESVPYVAVSVKSFGNNELLTGQITDDKGRFFIQEIPIGSWVLEIQFLGYKTIRQQVTMAADDLELDLGTILLHDEVATLATLEVTADRSTVEQKIDRKVINVGKDLATLGPSAADILVNIPSVDVDQNGNVSMRGNSNVMVLVDGKPTNLTASTLLQQIPSGSIKQIELITTPSSKYAPDGMSGMINVILHKNSNLGLNAKATGGLTLGHEARWNQSVDANYKVNQTNTFFTYGYTGGPTPTWGNISRLDDSSLENWLAFNDRTSHLIKLGVDQDLGKKIQLSAYSTQSLFKNEAFRSTDIRFQGVVNEAFGQEYLSDVENNSATYNLDIQYNLGQSSSLEFEVDHSLLDGREQADFTFFGSGSAVEGAVEQVRTKRGNTTLNLDYVGLLGNNKKIETGAEVRRQRTDNTFETTNPNFVDATYDFDRDIYSVYLSFAQDVGPWSYQIGARAEDFTTTGLFQEITSPQLQFSDQIYAIYPSIFLSYSPNRDKQNNVFNLSLSRRVDRPNLDQVNPIRAWGSARVTNVGNPALVPQFTNSLEFNYTKQLKDGSVTFGLFYRKIHDEIIRFGFEDTRNPGNILFSYNNYQDNSAYGVELSGNYELASWWSFTSSMDLYAQRQQGVAQGEFRSVNNLLFHFRMNHRFKATDKLTFQLVSFFRGANTNLQYKTLSFYFLNLGARYSVLDGRGTISMNLNDIFHTQRFAFEGERPVLQNGSFNWDSRTIFFGYSHRFGRGKNQSIKRKKRDNNEKKSIGGL